MSFCSNCGEKINEMKFCPSCGQKNITNIDSKEPNPEIKKQESSQFKSIEDFLKPFEKNDKSPVKTSELKLDLLWKKKLKNPLIELISLDDESYILTETGIYSKTTEFRFKNIINKLDLINLPVSKRFEDSKGNVVIRFKNDVNIDLLNNLLVFVNQFIDSEKSKQQDELKKDKESKENEEKINLSNESLIKTETKKIEKVNYNESKPQQKNNFLITFIITLVVGLIFFLVVISPFSSGGKNDPCKCLELQGLDQMGVGLNGNQMKYLNDCVGDYGSNFLYHCGKDSVNKKYGD